MGETAALILAVLMIAFIFWPQRRMVRQREKTRLDYLEERKGVVYDNLRDLNFEYQAGKYPDEDYAMQRAGLEDEAAAVMTEMDRISGARRMAESRASGRR